MQSFIQFVNEANLNKLYINGWTVYSYGHSKDRSNERRNEFEYPEWKHLHNKATEYINKNKLDDGEHLFYSRLKRQGYVARLANKNRQLHLITVLPEGSSRAKEGTQKHIIESKEYDIIIVD
jgi:hypothetical protein